MFEGFLTRNLLLNIFLTYGLTVVEGAIYWGSTVHSGRCKDDNQFCPPLMRRFMYKLKEATVNGQSNVSWYRKMKTNVYKK